MYIKHRGNNIVYITTVRVAHGGALHMNHRWLLAMSDRHNGRGAGVRKQRYCWGGSYMLDADTDDNPGFATRHVFDIGVRVTVNILQMVE